ncbi:MAG: hypothetical protein KDA25_13045 [Phycisphaerales bacterium]|nr:hypothetical protein [Phycisphaerales bacterium]
MRIRVRDSVRAAVFGAAMLGTAMLSGCYTPLFPSNAPRTQFENHDRVRNRYVPLTEEDVFGAPQPALRARLSPR